MCAHFTSRILKQWSWCKKKRFTKIVDLGTRKWREHATLCWLRQMAYSRYILGYPREKYEMESIVDNVDYGCLKEDGRSLLIVHGVVGAYKPLLQAVG